MPLSSEAMATFAHRTIQRFAIIEPLGAGGMGSVFRARDPHLDRDVAIKMIPGASAAAPGLSPDRTIDLCGAAPASGDDLLREARIMARLSHPNVVPVYEVGLADGEVFVVMEHVNGCDLRTWLEQPRSVGDIVAVFAQASRGIAAAHAHGIVHRDIKPANVLIGGDGRVRVADFGLSQLGARIGAGVLASEIRGTPHYMAPELWRGAAASEHSDVFAFCRALGEALAGRPLEARLGDVIARGLSEDPAARPTQEAVTAALERRPRAARRWRAAVTAAVAVAATGVAGLVAFAASDAADDVVCRDDPSLFAGGWDDGARAAFRAAFGRGERAKVDALIGVLDGRRDEVGRALRGACEARHAGQLTGAQAAARASCAERRAIELGATVRHQLQSRPPLADVESRVRGVARASTCDSVNAPARAIDRDRVMGLYGRYAALRDQLPAERASQAAAIERDATAAGELELAARSALELGIAMWQKDDLTGSDQALSRAYRVAIDIHAIDVAAVAVVERSRVAGMRGDASGARSFAATALDLAARPTTAPGVKARVYNLLGRADRDRGDLPAAAEKLQKALDIITADGQRDATSELQIRFDLITTLDVMEGRLPAALALARETEAMARRLFGERDDRYAIALNLLASVIQIGGDPAGALPHRRRALELEIASLPRDHANIYRQRFDLAWTLHECGRLEEARREVEIVLARAEKSESLRSEQPSARALLAQLTFQLGRHERGIRMLDEAIEELGSQHGKEHPFTLEARLQAIELRLEVGRVADAERRVAPLARSYRTQPGSVVSRLAYLDGRVRAKIARVRRRPREAEALARRALASIARLGDRVVEEAIQAELARILIDARRHGEASVALRRARELAAARHAPDHRVAELDVELARIEAATGRHREAARRARRARAVLENFPGAIQARVATAALLRRLR
jgi:eukaryotic-like serine/threonine-protein kinase